MAVQRALADGKSEALRQGNVRVAIIRSYTPLALQSAALVAVAGMSPYTECQSRDGGAVPASRPQRTPPPPPLPLPVPSFRAESSLGDPPGSHISATPPTPTPTPRPHPPGAAPIVAGNNARRGPGGDEAGAVAEAEAVAARLPLMRPPEAERRRRHRRLARLISFGAPRARLGRLWPPPPRSIDEAASSQLRADQNPCTTRRFGVPRRIQNH
ncbi:uncharacterized protein LOC126456589 [Schistocerca serialis cubense]|uniref:uncharacterized protein LOC126456589 n=1 Tax=Schistocerca serialis cubense TaxID=2023355 RepID=UPI00214E245D|nr:uncharacterized protein LOC126456589 [Schistocerca serialis cubense]